MNTVEENLDENIKYHVYENGLLIKEYVVGQTVFYEVVSKVDYKAEEIVKADTKKESNGLDRFQTVLDIAGLVPVFGEAADGVNGVIYAARGDELNAALSFGAMIPVAGWASTGGKFAVKGNNLYQVRNVVSTEKMESIYSPIYQDVVNSQLGKTQNQLDILFNTHYQWGTPNALTFNMPFAKTDIPTSIKSGDVDVKVEVKNVDVGAKGNVPKGYYQDASGRWHRPDGGYASNKEVGLPEPSGLSRRSEYIGTTPGKSSRTGKEVIERMENGIL